MIEDDVPEALPGFAEFSPQFRRSGYLYVIWGQSRDYWVLRRFDDAGRAEEVGFIKRHEGQWGFVDASLKPGSNTAVSADWRELVRLYS